MSDAGTSCFVKNLLIPFSSKIENNFRRLLKAKADQKFKMLFAQATLLIDNPFIHVYLKAAFASIVNLVKIRMKKFFEQTIV
jgi:hypothetical protein